MAGILIPVLIHLWNIRPGKTLAVGSIVLLKENGRRSSRRLQLSDLLLLFLRCLLIILLALLMAQPRWRSSVVAKEKGWLLIEKYKLPETCQRFQPQIDSLLQAGYALHYFTPGFPAQDLQTALRETAGAAADSASYWALIDSLQQHAGAPSSLYLFTPAYLSRFYGDRPHIDTGLHWYAYTPADSVSNWQADAYLSANGSIRVRKFSSRPSGNSYVYEEQPAGASLKADTATCRITIFADTYAHDAGYLKAAITAVQQFTQRKINLVTVSRQEALPPQSDWLFWLSARPLPENSKAGNIWQYDSGAVNNLHSWIIADAAPAPLYRRIQLHGPVRGKVLWKDGFGDPLLRLEEKGAAKTYHFSSRLDPAWNDLPWSPAFPGLLLELLFPGDHTPPPGKDRQVIAAQQLRPDPGNRNISRKRAAPPATDLAPLIWAAVVALFLAERVWVFRTKKSTADG